MVAVMKLNVTIFIPISFLKKSAEAFSQPSSSRGAFHSGKSVRDFSDFNNLRIFNGFSPDFLRIFRDKDPQNFHDFSPTFKHFCTNTDIFLDHFPNKTHLLSFTVFYV